MQRLLQFFECDHLPYNLKEVATHFKVMAYTLCQNLPHNAESTVALRKLLEAKDCAVRSLIYKE